MSRVRWDNRRSVSASSAGVTATLAVSSSRAGFRLLAPGLKTSLSCVVVGLERSKSLE